MAVDTSTATHGSVGVQSVLSAIHGLRSTLASFDPGVLLGPDCARVAEELAAIEKTCAGVRMVTAARAVDSGAHLSLGFKDGAAWLALQSGTTQHQAKRDLAIVDRLEECTATRDALLAGAISKDQATEIVEAVAEMPGAEGQLLGEARHSDLSRLRDKAREMRQARSSAKELHDEQRKARRFRHWRDRRGMVCFSGRLTPEVGVPFLSRMEQATARAKREAKAASQDNESWEAYAADAFADLCAPRAGDRRAQRTELVIVCDLSAWRRGHTHEEEVCHIIDGGPIPVDLAKGLCEDAFVKAVLYQGTDIHTIKHFGRHITAELRTALDLGPVPAFRGRECAECGKKWGLQYDHIDPVGNQGPTSYDNLQALCWADHQAKTRRDREAGLISGRHRGDPPDDR